MDFARIEMDCYADSHRTFARPSHDIAIETALIYRSFISFYIGIVHRYVKSYIDGTDTSRVRGCVR